MTRYEQLLTMKDWAEWIALGCKEKGLYKRAETFAQYGKTFEDGAYSLTIAQAEGLA